LTKIGGLAQSEVDFIARGIQSLIRLAFVCGYVGQARELGNRIDKAEFLNLQQPGHNA
jgi:hypothetical protein